MLLVTWIIARVFLCSVEVSYRSCNGLAQCRMCPAVFVNKDP